MCMCMCKSMGMGVCVDMYMYGCFLFLHFDRMMAYFLFGSGLLSLFSSVSFPSSLNVLS